MNQKKIRSFIAEFIAAPLCYLVAAVLLLFIAACLYCYFTKEPVQPQPKDKDTSTPVFIKKDPASKKRHDALPHPLENKPPETRLQLIAESCDTSWTTPLQEEIKGTIRKVEYSPQPGNGLTGLHLDVETADQEHFIVHISPEYKISRCPDLFTFQEGETVTVTGSELLAPGSQKNICAAEITRQNSEVLKLRDRITGKYNNDVFSHKICKRELKPTIYSCNRPWTSPLMEIEGIIRKVQYKKPPWATWSNQQGLHLDVETDEKEHFVIHVFPEPKIKQCPDLFHFEGGEKGERVIVVGSAFSTPESKKNICVAEIIRQIKGSETPELKVRDPRTGNHNNAVFNCTTCVDEEEVKKTCSFNWLKSYIDTTCKECWDEIAEWKNSGKVPDDCQCCIDRIARILGVYTEDCTHCQKIMCSSRCSGSIPYIMPPRCWKTCMENCGKITGKISGGLVNRIMCRDEPAKKL